VRFKNSLLVTRPTGCVLIVWLAAKASREALERLEKQARHNITRFDTCRQKKRMIQMNKHDTATRNVIKKRNNNASDHYWLAPSVLAEEKRRGATSRSFSPDNRRDIFSINLKSNRLVSFYLSYKRQIESKHLEAAILCFAIS
jgi:hypothetical protein